MTSDPNAASPGNAPPRAIGRLWLISMGESPPLCCNHAEIRSNWISFRASPGAPLSAGLHCELCSNRPGESTPPGVGVAFNRGATIRRVEQIQDADGPALFVEARLERFGRSSPAYA